jgi:pimeloyl-[acyl-carrier protein] methyl ester esterase
MQESSTIHYQVAGRGKPILLIHGWTMHLGVWDDFVQEFAAKYRIITVDLRGHGKSVSVG